MRSSDQQTVRMPILHLITGLPGSGKTTLAKRLEQELPALRLPPDEWIRRLGAPLDGSVQPMRDVVETIQFEVGVRAVRLGVNAVLENGFWTRDERERVRARAAVAGVATMLHHVDAPFEELWRRLELRNRDLDHATFRISRERLAEWSKIYEPPAADELVLRAPGGDGLR